MTKSLIASVEGLKIAKPAFDKKYSSHQSCATIVHCSRQVVGQFLRREPVETEIFKSICTELGLKWEEITELDADIQPSNQDVDLDEFVREVRDKFSASVQKRCGTMRVLDMEQPMTLDSIYTSVNILEEISRNQRRSIRELQEEQEVENYDQLMSGKKQERIPALKAVERHNKLIILGKPGAGKTTFLKWLALQCNAGKFNQNRVPLFITLKEFAETEGQPDLLGFITKQLTECGIDNGADVAAKILQEGRSIVLLDGLDEVKAQDHDRVLTTIRRTAEKFDASQFVITCRIAAKEYIFDQFTEVEIADFNDKQIADFAHKWFQLTDPIKAAEFPQELEDNPGLQNLATNPLLLTLLCLVFEAGGRFPVNRAELYKEGLDVLLKKWDANRNIKREAVYKQLSLQRKEDLLSQVAYNAFERSDYFFKQRFVEEQIRDYIRNLPNARIEPETLQLDSEEILKSIEAQHGLLVERARGIYSFSHLTFQEYFTARWFKEKADGDFGALISHVTDKQWREVFLLTVGMLQSADKLVLGMKWEIDGLLAQDKNLQDFLGWGEQKSFSIKSHYKIAAVRAYYLNFVSALDLDFHSGRGQDLARVRDLDLEHCRACVLDFARAFARDFDRALAHAIDQKHKHEQEQDLNLDLDFARAFDLAHARARTVNDIANHVRSDDLDDHARSVDNAFSRVLDRALVRSFTHTCEIESIELQESLRQLKNLLPHEHQNISYNWWTANGRDWTEKLRAIMIEYRNIGHKWQFSEAQKKLLQQYYDANKLLVDCLNSDCYVSREVRAEIEDGLLLPIKSLS
jgi:predicted NACHT family NTPase